jgi:DNA invertase Pin-like site-specific DNA recombinase
MQKDDTGEGLLIGYARVSTQDQKLEAQIDALKRAGVHPDHIHTDQASGVSRRRPGLALLMKDVRAGDTVVVWKLDRFGRSVSDLLKRLEQLDAMGVKFKSLTEAIDTTTPIGRLLLMVLGAVAQFERELIAERTSRGMQHRKSQGATFGRARVLTPAQQKEVRELVRQKVNRTDIARRFGISRGSVYNYSKRTKRK